MEIFFILWLCDLGERTGFFSLFWFYVSSENFIFDEIKGKNDKNLEFFKPNFSQSKEEPYFFQILFKIIVEDMIATSRDRNLNKNYSQAN